MDFLRLPLLALITSVAATNLNCRAGTPISKSQIESYKSDGTWNSRSQMMRKMARTRPGVGAGLSALLLNHIERLRIQDMIAHGENPPPGQDASSLLQGYPYDAYPALASKGTVRSLTLVVDFTDFPLERFHPELTEKAVEQNIYGAGTTAAQGFKPYESVHNYYQRASEGMLDIQGTVRICHLQKPRSAYEPARDRLGIVHDEAAAYHTLFQEALESLGPGFDFAPFSTDGRYLDLVNLLFVGWDSGWGGFWWDYESWFDQNLSDAAGVGPGQQYHVSSYIISRTRTRGDGNLDVRTLIHETGHALGLPDLYHFPDRPGVTGGVGYLDMMDGNWGNHNAFSRMLLGWITPEVISTGAARTCTLQASGSNSTAHKVVAIFPMLGGATPRTEMFLVENRSRFGNDAGDGGNSSFLPEDGLVIWHVMPEPNDSKKDFRYSNTEGDTQLIRLVRNGVEAPFQQDETATFEDYFGEGATFGPASRPASNRYSGEATGIVVKNISAAGETMTAEIGFEAPPNAFNIANATPAKARFSAKPMSADQTKALADLESLDVALEKYRKASAAELRSIFAAQAAPSSPRETALRKLTLVQWAAKDGQAAAETALQKLPIEELRTVFPAMMQAWARRQPASAAAWYYQSKNRSRLHDLGLAAGPIFAHEIFEWWSRNDLSQAIDMLDSLEAEDLKGAVEGIAQSAALQGVSDSELHQRLSRLRQYPLLEKLGGRIVPGTERPHGLQIPESFSTRPAPHR